MSIGGVEQSGDLRQDLNNLAFASVNGCNRYRAHGSPGDENLAAINKIGESLLTKDAASVDTNLDLVDTGRLLAHLARLAVSTRNSLGTTSEIAPTRIAELSQILRRVREIMPNVELANSPSIELLTSPADQKPECAPSYL